jgi:TonB-dependent receptor
VGEWNEPWSEVFPFENNHPITESLFDVDYDGSQDISAVYGMLDLPFDSTWSVYGGVRFESTHIGIVNDPDPNALWIPPGATSPVTLNPGDADVDLSQESLLPAIGLTYEPRDDLSFRASYSQTVARQTFRELTPIVQQEFLGAPIFIGNPDLGMSSIENWDLRVDFRPYEGGLLSASVFDKNIEDPIEYVQKIVSFDYTTAVNYPRGDLSGLELEVRHDLGTTWDAFENVDIGANATFLDGTVELTPEEIAQFNGLGVPMTTRDMTNTPDYLFNLYLIYDLERTDTRFGVFYTFKGDALVAGAGESNGNFVPSVYAAAYDTLNVSVIQSFWKHFQVKLEAKNLTNPEIQTVYRSAVTPEVTKTSFTEGIDFSLTFGATFAF